MAGSQGKAAVVIILKRAATLRVRGERERECGQQARNAELESGEGGYGAAVAVGAAVELAVETAEAEMM